MDKIIFWLVVIGVFVYASQNHWFDSVGNFFGMIKSDIEYQKSLVPKEPEKIDGGGVIEVEQESKTVRRSGLGTVHRGR